MHRLQDLGGFSHKPRSSSGMLILGQRPVVGKFATRYHWSGPPGCSYHPPKQTVISGRWHFNHFAADCIWIGVPGVSFTGA